MPYSNSKARGDETEALIIHRLTAAECSVSVPFGDNDKYDLIVDTGDNLHRIQCKTGWLTNKGTLRFNTHSQTTRDGEYHETAYHGDIDAFIVRNPEDDALYWIGIADATQQKMELRFEAAIDHPSINWADDYRMSEDEL